MTINRKGPPFSESLGPGGPPSVTLPAASVVGAKGIERLKRHMEICLSSEGGKVTWHWWKIGQPPPLLVLDSIFDLYLYIYISLYIYICLYIHFFGNEWSTKNNNNFCPLNPQSYFPKKNTSLLMRVHEKDILDHLGSRVCHALEGWKAGETLRGGLCQFPWHLA